MKNITKNILEYTVIFEPAEEGGYTVNVPAIPGCRTQGDTFEEAVANVKDAIIGCLEVLKEEGLEIPQEEPETVIVKVSVSNPTLTA
ncbi:antitoxin HicB [Candidatus Woesebacteria bacterium RIFCSPLOWO2_01_FULL_39_10]|uniref:Antitoxin HicB n=1 Tax=Candidatus Woesebacteria bacterium RIFCSPLOWO2_01_FULL_39_10 TaxID=1802516 RepID=A0A1F8B6Y3_9BACT|nr:MAG: antitoxin HicB [Candidatus Woesebacteria bacterium RIFCSPLOWO2_01_FULL_39_10]